MLWSSAYNLFLGVSCKMALQGCRYCPQKQEGSDRQAHGECIAADETCSNSYFLTSNGDGCPNPYFLPIILAVILYLAMFSPGMGTVPWCVNSEIFPVEVSANTVLSSPSQKLSGDPSSFDSFLELDFRSCVCLMRHMKRSIRTAKGLVSSSGSTWLTGAWPWKWCSCNCKLGDKCSRLPVLPDSGRPHGHQRSLLVSCWRGAFGQPVGAHIPSRNQRPAPTYNLRVSSRPL